MIFIFHLNHSSIHSFAVKLKLYDDYFLIFKFNWFRMNTSKIMVYKIVDFRIV